MGGVLGHPPIQNFLTPNPPSRMLNTKHNPGLVKEYLVATFLSNVLHDALEKVQVCGAGNGLYVWERTGKHQR